MEDIDRGPSSFVPDNYKYLNVMVVDNDPLFLKRITVILEAFTYQVFTTTKPALGLAMARKEKYERFQIVLANLEMMGIRRLSFLQILVKNCIPVVAILQDTNPNYFSKLKNEGATFCMVKPNDWPVLKDVWQYARLKPNTPVADKDARPSRKKHKQPPKSKDKSKEVVVREPGVMDKGKEIVREAEDMDNGQDDEDVGEPEDMNKEVVRESEIYFSVIGDDVVEWIAKPFKKQKGNINMYDHTEYYCQVKSRTPLSNKNGNPVEAESIPESFTENITTGARTNAISDKNNIDVHRVFGQLQKCASEAKRLYEQHFANGSFISEISPTQPVDNVGVSLTQGSNSQSSTRFAIRGPAISPASFATENCTSSLQWASTGSNSSSSLFGAVGFNNATTRYVQPAATNLQGAFATSSSQGQNAMQAANFSTFPYMQAQVAGPTLLGHCGQEFGDIRPFLGNTSDLSQFNLPTRPQGANSPPQVASQNQVLYSQVEAETSLRNANDENAIISNIDRTTQQPIESEDNLPSDFFENLETYFTTSDYRIDDCNQMNQIDANLSTPLIDGSLGLTNLLGEVGQDFADLMD